MPIRGSSPSTSMPTRWPALLAGIWLLASFAEGASAAEPGRPAARLLPAQGLWSYLEYDGLAAHDDAWRATAAREILAGGPAGAAIADTERRVMGRLVEAAGFANLSGADFIAAREHLARLGFAVATYEEGGEFSTVFVLNGFGDRGVRDRFARMFRAIERLGNGPFPPPTRFRGRDLQRPNGRVAAAAAAAPGGFPLVAPPTEWTWWLEGDALVVVNGPSPGLLDSVMNPERARKDLGALHRARVSSVLDAIETKRPDATTHPAYVAATAEGRDLGGFEPSGLFFVNSSEGHPTIRLGSSSKEGGQFDEFAFLKAAGLDRARRVIGRWGFRGKSLLTDVRFEIPTPWRGGIDLIDRRGFARGDLPPIPRGSGAFAVGAFDQTRAFDDASSVRGAMKPEALAWLEAVERTIGEATTRPLREALLRHLGPTWSIYAAPGRDGDASPAFLIGLDDPEAVDQALGALASAINDDFRKRTGEPKEGGDRPAIAIERLPAPDRGYRLTSPRGVVPQLAGDRQPTVLVGRSFLAVAANPALAREAILAELRPEARREEAPELARSLEALPSRVSILVVSNPLDCSWPEAIAGLPGSASGFLGKFLRVDLGDDPPANQAPDLLDVLGVPKRAGDRTASPKADELRRLIHPSVLTATVEGPSFRVIALEALPFSGLGFETQFAPSGALKIGIRFAPGR